ncbi:hypothetical protein BHE74_00013664 [Ensete ventricosum]|nr:hypothetical protein GW17_00017156 [Ensete ventricosum]RWW78133.1 hypothetical protein BHE74_00013664 [Ensete ventricosum]RZR90443.1 hypothetical protein BHM03_00018325 [Ensete ventricosum]
MGHLLALAPMPAVGLLAPPRVPAWRPSAVAAVAFDLSPVGRRSFPSRLKVLFDHVSVDMVAFSEHCLDLFVGLPKVRSFRLVLVLFRVEARLHSISLRSWKDIVL